MENLNFVTKNGTKATLAKTATGVECTIYASKTETIHAIVKMKRIVSDKNNAGVEAYATMGGKETRLLLALAPAEKENVAKWFADMDKAMMDEEKEIEKTHISKAMESCPSGHIVAKQIHFYGIECDAVYVSAKGEKFKAPSHYPKVFGEYRYVPQQFLLAKQDEKRVEAEKRAARLTSFIEKAQALGKPVLVRTYPVDNQGCRHCHAHEACEYVRPDGSTFIVTGHAD